MCNFLQHALQRWSSSLVNWRLEEQWIERERVTCGSVSQLWQQQKIFSPPFSFFSFFTRKHWDFSAFPSWEHLDEMKKKVGRAREFRRAERERDWDCVLECADTWKQPAYLRLSPCQSSRGAHAFTSERWRLRLERWWLTPSPSFLLLLRLSLCLVLLPALVWTRLVSKDTEGQEGREIEGGRVRPRRCNSFSAEYGGNPGGIWTPVEHSFGYSTSVI